MKKIIYLLFGVLLSLPSVATEMCARNDTIVIPLDSNVGSTGGGHRETEATWWVTFPYGRLQGLATCLSAAEGGALTTNRGAYTNANGEMLPGDDALAGRSGQDADGNNRRYCWCKMTHPASSRWVFTTSNASDCKTVCSYACQNYIIAYDVVRSGLFKSIGK